MQTTTKKQKQEEQTQKYLRAQFVGVNNKEQTEQANLFEKGRSCGLLDARVEAMKARRAEVHPSYQADFDILLLRFSKKFTRHVDILFLNLRKRFNRRSDLANDVMAGRDLFALLTNQLDSDFKAVDSFFTRSARRYERDAWLEQTTKEHGELIGIAVAAKACGKSVAVYRRQLKRLGVSTFACPIYWGWGGEWRNYLTKKDADRLNTEIYKQPRAIEGENHFPNI